MVTFQVFIAIILMFLAFIDFENGDYWAMFRELIAATVFWATAYGTFIVFYP